MQHSLLLFRRSPDNPTPTHHLKTYCSPPDGTIMFTATTLTQQTIPTSRWGSCSSCTLSG